MYLLISISGLMYMLEEYIVSQDSVFGRTDGSFGGVCTCVVPKLSSQLRTIVVIAGCCCKLVSRAAAARRPFSSFGVWHLHVIDDYFFC